MNECRLSKLKPISMLATEAELWNRTPIAKTIVVKVNSMLPQIKVTPRVLRKLLTFPAKTPTCILSEKYSSGHLLTLQTVNVIQLTRGSPFPTTDYLIHTSLGDSGMSDDLKFNLLRRIERKTGKLTNIGPLELCRTCLGATAQKDSVTVNSELIFPYANFSFTQIAPLKVVCTPLSVKLTKLNCVEFQVGFLTLDQHGRVLPLLMSDPMALQYPLVGIWAASIPENLTFTGRYTEIAHPLLWATCVQYLESRSIRERISPAPSKNCFLFIQFSSKPKFFEISSENAFWCKANVKSDIHRKNDPFFVSFLKNAGSLNNSCTDLKPPRARRNLSSDSARTKRTFSPNARKVIGQQQEMVRKLQEQLNALQTQVYGGGKASAHLGASVETNFTDCCRDRNHSEASIHVPKIEFEGVDWSLEPEELARVERKYLV